MKQVLALLFVVATLQLTTAQKVTVKRLKQTELNQHKKIVTQALTYNDTQTAINSMHAIITLEGANSIYKDSLAITYYNARNYVSSHLLAKELLVSKPNNLELLEINAVSLQSLNATKQAIDAYETLFRKTNNMIHGYQLAMLQNGVKRYAEAKTTIAKTVECKEIENAMVQMLVDKNQNQNVPLKAAVYNLQGLVAYALKDNATARTAFNNALKIMPKFALATQNANALAVVNQNAKNKMQK